MNRRDIEKVKEEKERYGEKVATVINGYFYVAIVYALFNEFGFKQKRLKRALKAIVKEVESLSSGMIGLTWYKDYLDEKTGFDWRKLLDEEL